MTVPAFPADTLREAIRAGDWDTASGLIDQHHHDLAQALAAREITGTDASAAWTGLLLAQRAMLAELRDARDGVAATLARLGSDQRGVRAYLQRAGP